jgi:bifunctional oligoribonuclease and PAP phosphatase NrnA
MSSQALSQQLRTILENAGSVLFTGPSAPDGDSIGACLALAQATATFSEATLHVGGEANFRYDWMPGAETLHSDAELQTHYDVVVVMDGDRTRLTPIVTALFQGAKATALVDHHGSSSPDGYDVVILNPTSPSTCEMVATIIDGWGIPLNAHMATHLYTGIIFDTGGFKHENTQAETHRLASRLLDLGVRPAPIHAKVLHERTSGGLQLLGEVLGAARFYAEGAVAVGVVTEEAMARLSIVSGDTEGIIDALLNTAGVEVAVLAKEAGAAVKLSLRSKSRVNVAAIAKSLHEGGGGHIRAAGCRVPTDLKSLMARLPDVLTAAVV